MKILLKLTWLPSSGKPTNIKKLQNQIPDINVMNDTLASSIDIKNVYLYPFWNTAPLKHRFLDGYCTNFKVNEGNIEHSPIKMIKLFSIAYTRDGIIHTIAHGIISDKTRDPCKKHTSS